MQGLLAKKVGMTRVFDAEGRQIPVTVLEVGPCIVVQRKTNENDGYEALQIGFIARKEQRVTAPQRGRFKAAAITPLQYLQEFALDAGDNFKAGDTLTVSLFDKVECVDISGVTKGRGFQGVVRRHGMSGGPITHGGHSKRRVGSIGCRSFPGRVHKNKRMPGHMGSTQVTQKNLKVIQVRGEDNLLLVRGAVPGPAGAVVAVKRSLKKA